ncbi:MAG: endopeptidase La [Bacteroidetes bacterium]|nr:endopeptidase La [Bacteroidota bacterium]
METVNTKLLPILPLRNTVIFPGVIIPITIGRPKSQKLIEEVLKKDKIMGVVAQKDPKNEDPESNDLYRVGTVVNILKLLKLPDGSQSVVIQGSDRFQIRSFHESEPFFRAEVDLLTENGIEKTEADALILTLKNLSNQLIDLNPNIPNETKIAIENIDTLPALLYFIASNLPVTQNLKQELLETGSLKDLSDKILAQIQMELSTLELSSEIQQKVKTDMEKAQKEFYLRQQLKAIQAELGESDSADADIEELKKRAKEKKWPKEIQDVFDHEIKKLQRQNPAAADYSVTRNYIDWLLDLPWREFTADVLDLKKAEKILNEDHYDLEKVKKRILEYLAVLKLKQDMKGPILCFYGPPGVGKTSLGQSIARSLGRNFVRISLGGVRDEAEIRGHRRTYVGALPGRILQGMKKAKSDNPVFMLDEIDKLGMDFRGDPSSALLEVLDPEQNHSFSDHYMEVPYDLSKVIFIATANSLETIPGPLRDRMEIIELSSYTEIDKLQIARQYLIPRQVKEHGLKEGDVSIPEDTLKKLIGSYTREAGVRSLERTIGAVCRNVAKNKATGKKAKKEILTEDLESILGPEKYFSDVAEQTEMPGVATGMAWTPVGGDILFIEAGIMPGSGRLTLTGQLGDVMKESVQAAITFVKAHAHEFGIDQKFFTHFDLHIHVPAGAIPKDGPSAGVAMLSAVTSIFTQRKIRSGLSMTGEITLRGLVLPVGGIKEKVLAAKRAGIREIILPERNQKDVKDMTRDAVSGLKIHYVKRMRDVLDLALDRKPVQNPAKLLDRIPGEEKK